MSEPTDKPRIVTDEMIVDGFRVNRVTVVGSGPNSKASAMFTASRAVELEVEFSGFTPTPAQEAAILKQCATEYLRSGRQIAGLFRVKDDNKEPDTIWPSGYAYRVKSDTFGEWRRIS